EMLAGQPPFTRTQGSLAYQHMNVEPRPVTELRPNVPKGVAAAIAKSLAKLPADRHATAARFAEALAVDASRSGSRSLPLPGGPVPNNVPPTRAVDPNAMTGIPAT